MQNFFKKKQTYSDENTQHIKKEFDKLYFIIRNHKEHIEKLEQKLKKIERQW